jgi:alcohol dehydrogenase class IV
VTEAQPPADFVWRDAGRTVFFTGGSVESAARTLAEQGWEEYELISTERALAGAGDLRAAASAFHEVAAGPVPAAAGTILESAGGGRYVALGGGRAIDTAKAVAAVTGAEVAALPTTLSGAEMTGIHRLPEGAEERSRGMVRPALVLADPEAMTSQPEAEMRASAMNALAHGADSIYTSLANPVSRWAALRGAELIAGALDEARDARDRRSLALGALLCGYAIDSALFAIHHVVCQTLVRVCGSPHAETNAAILPRAMSFMATRAPEQVGSLARALGVDLAEIEERIFELGGRPRGLGELGADRGALGRAIDAMLGRSELGLVPSPPDREDLRRLVDSAW